MDLTREQAISKFRKMWNWIADKTLERKKKVEKEEYFEEKNLSEIECDCYLCEYVADKTCKEACPIDFGGSCNSLGSPYLSWLATFPFQYDRAAKLAREIANLPEREMEE